jgi:hypothetical protein
MDLSVIIPSKTASNLIVCVKAVRDREPDARIIVIDDFPVGKRPGVAGVEWREGIHPFVFARNINLGITGCNGDVVLLNDDAILETPGGFWLMQKALAGRLDYGLIAANYKQSRIETFEEAPKMVPFICVLIPRRTIDLLKEIEKSSETYPGLLDERFVGYGYDDDDYCLRVRRAGMKVGTFGGCRVNHSRLKSTYRTVSSRPPGLKLAREIFCAKWGKHPA